MSQEVYTPCVIAVFFITLPLCFKNLQNTKKFTVVIMWCRFLAITILLIVGVYKSIERFRHENFQQIMLDVPLWKPSGFVAVFGNSVFLCGIHHYLPSMFPGWLAEVFFCLHVFLCISMRVAASSQATLPLLNVGSCAWGTHPKPRSLKGFCTTRGCHNWLVVWNMTFIFPYIGNNHPN